MEKINSAKLAEILGCRTSASEIEIEEISTDSRKISPRTLFIALRGERFDAHDFVAEVLANGCPLAVVDHAIDGIDEKKLLIVNDTLKAYGKIGAYNRSLFKGKVIGLTGSAGKTTTKEEISFLLSKFARTYATKGNHNNAIGVPQSLCEIDMRADYAVIEMGMSAAGEIAYLTDLVKPDIAVVTNVYQMHIEFFNSFADIALAKAEIFSGLRKGGIAIINQDTNFADILEKQALVHTKKLIKFGKANHPLVDLNLPENGEKYLYNAWCALTVVAALGLDINKAAAYLKDFGALEGRGKHHLLHLPNGTEYTLIDDSYSGQPEAMKFAIKDLDNISCQGRKIALLGKMAELGATSKSKHQEIGRILADSSVDIIIGVCPEMKDMLAQLPEKKIQYYFDNKDGITDFLLNKLLQKGDVILIKGARYSSKMYQVAEELIEKGAVQ